MITIKIKTWACPDCGYKQDFQPTKELMAKHFEKSDDLCPSCGKTKLQKEVNAAKKITINIRDTDEESLNEKGERVVLEGLASIEIQKIKDKYEDK